MRRTRENEGMSVDRLLNMSGRLLVVSLIRAGGLPRTTQERPVIGHIWPQLLAGHCAFGCLLDRRTAPDRNAANPAHPLMHERRRDRQARSQLRLPTHHITRPLDRRNRVHA